MHQPEETSPTANRAEAWLKLQQQGAAMPDETFDADKRTIAAGIVYSSRLALIESRLQALENEQSQTNLALDTILDAVSELCEKLAKFMWMMQGPVEVVSKQSESLLVKIWKWLNDRSK